MRGTVATWFDKRPADYGAGTSTGIVEEIAAEGYSIEVISGANSRSGSQPPLLPLMSGENLDTGGVTVESLETAAQATKPDLTTRRVTNSEGLRADDQALTQSSDVHSTSPKPRLELHFNLWRDLSPLFSFLDIGLLLSNTEQLGRIYVYVPAYIDPTWISDLSPVLKDEHTLNAVFNSVISLKSEQDYSFEAEEQGEYFATIHSVNTTKEIFTTSQQDLNSDGGSVIAFGEALCERIRSAERALLQSGKRHAPQYLRFRIRFPSDRMQVFSSVLPADESAWSPSFESLELIDFRLNEKRSYPRRVADLAEGKEFHVEAVHYFLIREATRQLVMQHAPNHKVRRLEGLIWNNYLEGRPYSGGETRTYPTERMLIYHWKKQGSGTPREEQAIDDFTAFASFRGSEPNLKMFIFGAVLLGAVGSSTSTVVTALVQSAITGPIRSKLGLTLPEGITTAVTANLIGVVIVIGLLWAVYRNLAKRKRQPRDR
ncbi:hypothetical protein [Rubellimicrobium roseum]|uniref:Uncharacterized protein n=1 Tax=Rubellimicrobium roseum TaxID=687525 RepID=A0A5C4NMJ0_9RHOB|nr:hypothetical protein [Rubellimicrobium roseum]TNC74336.1 hypothetical protein FHG71_03925 [Rubellimicrobium roseum]